MIYLTHEQVRCRINLISGIHSDLYIELSNHGTYKKEFALVDKEFRALMAIYDYPDARLAKEQIDIPQFEDGKSNFCKEVRRWFSRPRTLPGMGKIGFLHPI